MRRKELAILRALGSYGEPTGATRIARDLHDQGIELTERAVRYHLQALDARGLTEGLGRSGRRLTEAGQLELANARVADKTALSRARMDAFAYQTSFDIHSGQGQVALNVTLFRHSEFDQAMRIMRPVFVSRYTTSDLVAVFDPGQQIGSEVVPRGMVGLGTICSVTIQGVLLSHGIPVNPEFGGLMQIAGHEPVRFTELVRYAGTSVDPVEMFIRAGATSVGQTVATGEGLIGAGLRTCPAVAREQVLQVIDEMAAWRIRGVVAAGGENQSLMEIDVDPGRLGFVVAAGINPAAAAAEAGMAPRNKAMAMLFDYTDLEPVG